MPTRTRCTSETVSHRSASNAFVANNPAVATIWSGSFNVPFPLMAHFITEHEAIFGDAVDEASSPVVQSPYSASSSPVDQPSGPSMSDLRSPRKQMFSDLATPAAGQSQFPDNISSRLQPSGQSQQISHQQHQPSTVPQQTYRSFQPIHPSGADQGFGGSLNAALAPTTTLPSNAPSSLQTLKSAETTKEIKKARRESGLKNLISAPLSPPPDLEGKRKSSMGRLRELAGGKEDR